MGVSSRLILTILLMFVLGGAFFGVELLKGDRVQMVYCDVGQGDGFVLFGGGGKQIVFDGGLGGKMADCLGRYMPFWDREIDAMVLTHAQKDHMEGQVELLKRYRVRQIVWSGAVGSGASFDEWKKLVGDEGAQIYEIRRGDRIEFGNIGFEVLWPTKRFMDLWKLVEGSDLNETSVVVRMNYGGVCAYFTGDIPVARLGEVVDKNCQILKVAHHGSKTGTNDEVIEKMRPKLAIIQVGATNNYGHPNREVLDSLNKFGVEILRNDIQGDVLIQFENNQFKVVPGKYFDKVSLGYIIPLRFAFK